MDREPPVADDGGVEARDRQALIEYVIGLGATEAEAEASPNLGELALDVNLRPRTRVRVGDTVGASGIDAVVAHRLMSAVGLPSDPDALITDAEADVVLLLADACHRLLGEEATLQLARVAGQGMARVAETLVGVFRLQVELPQRDAGVAYLNLVKGYADIAATVLPSFTRMLDTLLRRQIVATAERVWSTDDERSAMTLPRAVGFVDLVGYTESTSSLSVRDFTRLLLDFDRHTADVVGRGNGTIIKTIGDEVMFATETADDACRIALDLVDATDTARPAVRVGIAAGEVISVFGDLYGTTVNLAARLVAAGEPGRPLVSDRVRADATQFGFRSIEPLQLKGFAQPVAAYEIERASRPDG